MAQIGDFFARLVSAGGTRGLSGDADRVLPAEPVFAFFNDRLRKHHTAEDFVADPGLIWSTQTFLSRRGGLEAHLRAERGDGVAGFSDILVVVNPHDWRRSLRLLSEPWAAVAAHRLRTRFRTFCEENDFHRLFPQRPMGVRVVEDGGLEMGGASIGLEKGELVTGLLPNFYAGAHATSRPVVAFHLNIPGAWSGYREVGRLYSDQVLFTLGSHWLDNYQHPKLQLPALYRLQQFADGSFVHIVNPEAMPDVRILEQESNGATVLTLQHVSGVALAHIVLAMLDADSSRAEPGAGAWSGASQTDDDIDLADLEEVSSGIAPVVPDAFQQSRTVVPAEVGARLLTLRERGVLLQRVHFARFMSGYDVFIGPGGEVGTALEAPSATLQIRRRSMAVVAHVDGVTVDGQALTPGRPLRLKGDRQLQVGGTRLELRDLSDMDLPHWPYLLEIRRPGNSSHLVFGRTHRVGRDPRCSVRLPDEPHNGNIVWRPEVAASSVIRSRNGEIPKSRFYIDSIMVASEHAELDLTDVPTLRGRARDCYCYVRRDGKTLPIVPKRLPTGSRALGLQPRDELLIGNCVFQVGWADGHLSMEPEPLTAELLASAVDELATEDRPPMPSLARTPDAFDAPVAGGLGERGPTPPRFVPPSPATQDSLLSEPIVRTKPPPARAAPPLMNLTEPPPPAQSSGEPPEPPEPPRIGPPMMGFTEPPPTGQASVPPPLTSPPPPRPLGPSSAAPPMMAFTEPPPPALSSPPPGPAGLEPDDPTEAAASEQVPPVPPLIGPPMMEHTEPVVPVSPERIEGPPMFDGTEPIVPVPPEQLVGPPMMDQTDPVTPAPSVAAGPPRAEAVSVPPSTMAEPPVIPESLPTVTGPASSPSVGEQGADEPAASVAIVDESAWQLELGRPARLVVAGWMVAGKHTVGNHYGCSIVLPENRVEAGQAFTPRTLAQLKVRGRRGHVRLLEPQHATLLEADAPTVESRDLTAAMLRVARLDADGDIDFHIDLSIVADPGLPDPRAQMLRIDHSDPMVAGLFTLGLPLGTPRAVRLGPIVADALWNGSVLHVSGYLDSYVQPDGSFLPFFRRVAGSRFQTIPEDGRTFTLTPGDTLLCGATWLVFEVDDTTA